MVVSTSDRFSSTLKTLDEVPEPFKRIALQSLSPQHNIQLLVWGPASKTIRSESPATLLSVTDRGWLVVAGVQNANIAIACCDFANTLLIELTSILLYGRLKIVYVNENRNESISIEFNTVMQKPYQEAVQLLLEGINGVSSEFLVVDNQSKSMLNVLPFKFQNAVFEYKPRSQKILSVLHWSAIFSESRWIQHELNPQAVLVLTERELIFISEEKAWSWFQSRRANKYGQIVTYCHLSRLEGFELGKHRQMGSLDLEIRSLQSSEKLRINFPYEKVPDVAGFMERTMKQKMLLKHGMQ
jgi:hypothetical protein